MSARKTTKPSDITSPNLRIRRVLRQQLEIEARKNQTTLNGEMARRLQQSLDTEAMMTIQDLADKLARRHRKLIEA